MKLTDTKVRQEKAQARDRRVPDGAGLCLMVTAKGAKLWQYRYRFQGTPKLMALGAYPAVSLSDARTRHAEARRLLASGVDPMAQRKADRVATKVAGQTSFEVIAKEWHAHWKAGKTDRHAAMVLRRLEADVFPAIGMTPISEIEAPAVVAMVRSIEARGANDVAKRALETTGQIFRYGVAHGYCKRNPAADIKPSDVLKSVAKKNYARVKTSELPELLRAIEVYQGTPVTRLAIKIMAHTFVRTGELIGARWEEIDFAGKRWEIPKERMKMRTPHIVPLSSQALELFQLLHSLTGSGEFVFPVAFTRGKRKGGLKAKTMSNNTILKALDRMGYKYEMTGHGFRGIASTILNENDFDEQHVDLQLAHMKRNKVSAAYNHAKYLKQRTAMMQWWSNHLENAQRGKTAQD